MLDPSLRYNEMVWAPFIIAAGVFVVMEVFVHLIWVVNWYPHAAVCVALAGVAAALLACLVWGRL